MIKKLLKAFTIAFSVYSKIPMPHFMWESKEMEYSIGFFPLVGAVIGGIEWGWFNVCEALSLPVILKLCVAVLLPLLITGGIHIDGFMDTSDALNSYQPKEKKLEILKDPHIGAFSVISLCIYFLTALGFLSVINTAQSVIALSVNFMLARVFSALGVITRKKAKSDGMLHAFSGKDGKTAVFILLSLQAVAGLTIIGLSDLRRMIIILVSDILVYLYYCYKSNKEFGGITGDLAGWFLSLAELFCVIVMAVYEVVLSIL